MPQQFSYLGVGNAVGEGVGSPLRSAALTPSGPDTFRRCSFFGSNPLGPQLTREAEAQYNMGVYHAQGTGGNKDDQEAARWYRKAANQGHPHAQHNLGLLYTKGQGLPKDLVAANTWFRIAGARGHAGAIQSANYLNPLLTVQRLNSSFQQRL
jgi:TPR repeat protein